MLVNRALGLNLCYHTSYVYIYIYGHYAAVLDVNATHATKDQKVQSTTTPEALSLSVPPPVVFHEDPETPTSLN